MNNQDSGDQSTVAATAKDGRVLPPEALRPWLKLLHTPGLGARRINQLLAYIEDPATLFQSGHPNRAQLKPELRQQLDSYDQTQVEQDLQWLASHPRHAIVPLTDPAYPGLLRQIDDPPPLLYVSGELHHLQLPQLAIVGSRNPSPGGRELAHDFAHCFCQSGLTVTSGLALGIDAAAHRGALDAGGPTLAVVGTGLDRVYPARHHDLAHAIVDQGAMISEFPPGTPPKPDHFPRRNRIISGMSLGTLVVEAAKRSGSLITARLASEQGREVFAIPGSIHNPLARGCHTLIRQGAKLVESAEDVLEELAPLFHAMQPTTHEPADTNSGETGWDEDYTRLFAAMGHDPVTTDQIIQRSGLTADAVSSMLLLLELDGHVHALAGGRFERSTNSGNPSTTGDKT